MREIGSEARRAAANNADLYAAILGAHGLGYERDASAFLCLDDPPPYYAKFVTLDPVDAAGQADRIRALVASGQRADAVKDSFAALDPSALGLAVLFEASWVWRDGRSDTMPAGWQGIEDARGLAAWHEAWRAGSPTEETVFPPACLDDPSLVCLARRAGSAIEAGCLANRSGDVIGLSNVFSQAVDHAAFAEAAQAVSAVGGGRAVVGYEHGGALVAALSAGFREVGPLRVLVRHG